MPEGHTIHRLAAEQQKLFGRRPVQVSSPQGRFAEGAKILDGRVLKRTEANGKHLFHHYEGAKILHIHLGLYGKFSTGTGEAPEPRGALRLRLANDEVWSDLRGPTVCELIEPPTMAVIAARLGPDPLRKDANPARAYDRLQRSRTSVAAMLMDQAVVAGIGNVYRAELLFRHQMDPYRPGRDVTGSDWLAMWADLVTLMRAGVKAGRIVTVHAADAPTKKKGPPRREDSHYVYRRAGLPCRVCGTEVRTAVLVGRNLFWCPQCQSP
jgi:endonuclease-8